MRHATAETALGNFDGATLTKDGSTSTFFKRDGKLWVNTDGPDGKLADFEIRFTFGVYPLQQYLIELPGGRLQALGIAWDARSAADGGQRWYHLYPDQKLSAGNPLHWTGIDQNWNYQCAFCHSTNLKKGFDKEIRTFRTTWSEISVGCEACHGPASRHVTWAETGDSELKADKLKGFALTLDERRGVTWQIGGAGQPERSVPRSTAKEIQMCAACHSRRQQFADALDDPSQLFDAFRPSPLEPGLYFTDGQQRDEVYTYGSFVQSRMHAAGVTCSDCHNPHTGKLRQTGNQVCAQCHAPDRFDTAAHHRHADGSKAALCTSCHMPTRTYMGVDERHDHSMRIPRPDRTIVLGTPNACNACHQEKSPSWAADAVKRWYPAQKPGAQDFAEAYDLGDRAAPGAQSALLQIAKAGTSSGIARASALVRLGQLPSQEVLDLAAYALGSEDPLVRSAAIGIVGTSDEGTRRQLLAPLLRDPSRLVRMDAARALAGAGEATLAAPDREALGKALSEYAEAQLFNAERPEALANLGGLQVDRGETDAARRSFETAIEIDPTFAAAAISLADMERGAGNESAAEAILRKALSSNPASGAAHHALGLSLIRQKRTTEAMAALTKAVELAPEDARFSYVLAVALHDTGKLGEAIAALKNAEARHFYNRDILWTLALYEAETGDTGAALKRLELLARLEPHRTDIAQALSSLRRRTRQ